MGERQKRQIYIKRMSAELVTDMRLHDEAYH